MRDPRLPAGRPVRRRSRRGSGPSSGCGPPDIYGDGTVIREVFSLRGADPPGQLRRPDRVASGEVYGVVFAASVTDKDTGYALTAGQVSRAATLGVSATKPVSTRGCA